MITGCLAFIPYVGVIVGVVLAMAVSLLEYDGPGQLIAVAGVFAVVQTLEGLVITPRVVGEKVGLGPVGVLLALMIGGQLFGFVGILLAVPVAASVVIVIKKALSTYKDSLFYAKGAEEADDTEAGQNNDEEAR